MLYCCPIDFATPEMDEALHLRYKVLRKPLQLDYFEEDILQEWNSIHLGAFNENDQLAGVLVLKMLTDKTLKMRQVAIDDTCQNKGYGKALVRYSESYAIKHGFNRLELHARMAAVPFYEKLGYISVGDIFREVGIDHLFMYKDL
jgi:predicted GNAT family N-acyltransferase